MPSTRLALVLRVLAGVWSLLAVAGLAICGVTLLGGRPVPLPDLLVPVLVALFVAGAVATMAIQSRAGYTWWRAVAGSGGPLLGLTLLGFVLALTGVPALLQGVPGDAAAGCPYPVDRYGTVACVSQPEYDRIAAGVERLVVGFAAAFFSEFARHAVNITLRRRLPTLSTKDDSRPDSQSS